MKIKTIGAVLLSIFASLGHCFADDTFIYAAGEGNIDYIKRAMKHSVDLNEGRSKSPHHTALHNAARKGHLKIVIKLIEAGANVEARDKWARTPLMYAASKPNNWEVISKLIAAGADPNALGKAQETPLYFAVDNTVSDLFAIDNGGDLATVLNLIKAGADVNKQNEAQVNSVSITPLHLAALHRRLHIVRALLAAGAQPNIQLSKQSISEAAGDTPLHIAARQNYDPSIACALLAWGADPNLKNRYNLTPLDLVIQNVYLSVTCKKALIVFLLLAGAEIPTRLKSQPLIMVGLDELHKLKKKIG